MDELKPGTFVTPNIRLVRPLSSGAMGSVWVAHHAMLETQVAVKFIHKDYDKDNVEVRARFAIEAKTAARIKSPHVVSILDHGTIADGRPYMVMELLEGESLAGRLERTGWLSVRQTVQVVQQVAKALGRAHELGIIHRDVKPENIFLCRSEDGFFVKLLDFGIAKESRVPHKSGLTSPGVMVGTAEYMSREQVLSSREVAPSADLWALAVVAYEMLTGDVPFTGETLGMICVAICSAVFTPPSTKRKECGPEVDAWFERALNRDPDERFASARELAETFRAAILGGERIGSFSDERVPAEARPTGVGIPTPLQVSALADRATPVAAARVSIDVAIEDSDESEAPPPLPSPASGGGSSSADPDLEPEREPDLEPDSDLEPERDREPDPDSDPGVDAESEADSASDSEPGPESESVAREDSRSSADVEDSLPSTARDGDLAPAGVSPRSRVVWLAALGIVATAGVVVLLRAQGESAAARAPAEPVSTSEPVPPALDAPPIVPQAPSSAPTRPADTPASRPSASASSTPTEDPAHANPSASARPDYGF